MKKFLLVLILVLSLITIIGVPAAFAGGWFKTSTDPAEVDGDFYWRDTPNSYNSADATSPHLGFSTTSNQCRVCHAVHLANATSWRLLKNGNTDETRTAGEYQGENGMGNKRSTECMYCHDSDSGMSSLRPYGVLFGKTVRGEHTLGATWIPDSSVNDTATQGDGRGNLGRKNAGAADAVLDCYQCHSVHGANILKDVTGFGWDETQPIDNFILRDDPAGNGYENGISPNDDGINSIKPPWINGASQWNSGKSKDTSTYPVKDPVPYTQYSIWKYEVQAAWCGDCHNENPNITGPGDFRPNTKSHPLFGGNSTTDSSTPFTGGWMEIFGTTQQVSGAAPKGCEQCHMSGQKVGSQVEMSWPHQSEGSKFLVRSETDSPMVFKPVEEGSKTGPGDSNRVIPNMDKACLWCHRWNAGASGVGLDF